MDSGRPLAIPDQIGIAVVLEDRHAIFGREIEKRTPALLRHDRAGRVLHSRDGVDEFRLDVALLQRGQLLRQGIDAHAVAIEWNSNNLNAEPLEPIDRTLIAVLLDDHRITTR